MTETLFTFDERNYRDCQDRYRGDVSQEYYLGDYTIEAAANIEVRAERKGVGSSSIILLHSRTRMRFDRSWAHIQQDATDVIVLWFVRNGRMEIRTPEGLSAAGAGDFAITRSMQPFGSAPYPTMSPRQMIPSTFSRFASASTASSASKLPWMSEMTAIIRPPWIRSPGIRGRARH